MFVSHDVIEMDAIWKYHCSYFLKKRYFEFWVNALPRAMSIKYLTSISYPLGSFVLLIDIVIFFSFYKKNYGFCFNSFKENTIYLLLGQLILSEETHYNKTYRYIDYSEIY